MIINFIKLRIKETTRSAAWGRSVVINIIFALFLLCMFVNFLMVGFLLDRMLLQSFPGSDPVELLNRVLLYYFGLELLVRFFMQSTPAMSVTPFMHLPVKRSFLMHFLLARSIISPVSYIAFVIFIPFAIRAVSTLYGGAAACWWLFSLFLTVLFVIYLNVYIKRQLVVKPAVSAGCGLAYVALITLELLGVLKISEFSSSLFTATLEQPLWALVPASLVAGAYLLNYRFLMRNSYPEEIDRTIQKKQVTVQKLDFVSRFGLIGELIGLELKLILRNKRTKSVFYFSFMFFFYGFLFYTNPMFNNNTVMLIITGVLLTGLMMLNYAQFIVAWEGKFFDGILTRNVSLFDYFQAKYYMLVSFCIISYILTAPYAFYGINILWIQTACFLFNAGFGACIMLWFAQYNHKRIDLTQASAFNWQGSGASQFLIGLPIFLLPLFIVLFFKLIGFGDWGFGALAILGVIGILCHKWILQSLCRKYADVKYTQAEGFRES